MNHEFIIMERQAKMPGSCWGSHRYRKFAVVEIDPSQLRPGDTEPRMISERARGVVEIHAVRDRIHCGGPKSACWEVIDELRRKRDRLQAKYEADKYRSDFPTHHGTLQTL